ncbi:MAG: hypothetical protein WBL80_09430 [Erysipelotrichaceae bacterium]
MEKLLNAFIMVSWFMAFASFCTVGDMGVGAWKNKEKWDGKKFLSGMKWALILYVFFLWLVGAVTMLPMLLAHFNIANINQTTIELFSAVSVATAFSVLSVLKIYNMGINLYGLAQLKFPDKEDKLEPVLSASEDDESAVG